MSAIAMCAVVEPEMLSTLAASPREWSKVTAGATTISYGWSGYVLVTLLVYLEQRGINLMDTDSTALTEAFGATCFVLEPRHRALIPALEPSEHDATTLREFYEAFNEAPGDGVEQPLVDGVRFLRDALGSLSESTVGLLVIG